MNDRQLPRVMTLLSAAALLWGALAPLDAAAMSARGAGKAHLGVTSRNWGVGVGAQALEASECTWPISPVGPNSTSGTREFTDPDGRKLGDYQFDDLAASQRTVSPKGQAFLGTTGTGAMLGATICTLGGFWACGGAIALSAFGAGREQARLDALANDPHAEVDEWDVASQGLIVASPLSLLALTRPSPLLPESEAPFLRGSSQRLPNGPPADWNLLPNGPPASWEYANVDLFDAKGKNLGELDLVSGDTIIEDKAATGLGVPNPRTGKPFQTAADWAKRAIFEKTASRIDALKEVASVRPGPLARNPDAPMPAADAVSGLRSFHFRTEATGAELDAAMAAQVNRLRNAYPDFSFSYETGYTPQGGGAGSGQ